MLSFAKKRTFLKPKNGKCDISFFSFGEIRPLSQHIYLFAQNLTFGIDKFTQIRHFLPQPLLLRGNNPLTSAFSSSITDLSSGKLFCQATPLSPVQHRSQLTEAKTLHKIDPRANRQCVRVSVTSEKKCSGANQKYLGKSILLTQAFLFNYELAHSLYQLSYSLSFF